MNMIKNTIFLGKIARLTTTPSPPCVDSTRRRVYVQHVTVYTGVRVLRVESTHWVFQRATHHTHHTDHTTREEDRREVYRREEEKSTEEKTRR